MQIMHDMALTLLLLLLIPSCLASQNCSIDVEWKSWSPSVRIFAARRFLEPVVAAEMVQIAEAQGLEPDASAPPYALVDADEHPVVRDIMRRVAGELLGMPLEAVATPTDARDKASRKREGGDEPFRQQMRVRRTRSSDAHFYKTGSGNAGFFARHSDAMQWPSGRVVVATVFLYLADPPTEGGETVFPEANVTLRATALGDAFVWYNCKPNGGSIMREADHMARGVIEGTKWTSILFAVGNPSYCAGFVAEPSS